MENETLNTSKKNRWTRLIFFWDWSIFEKSLLGVNFVISLIFLILSLCNPNDFSAFTDSKINFELFKNDTWRIVLDILSFFTSIINTCCLLLITKKKISNFIWGICAVALLGSFNLICGNIGTFIVNWVIQLPINILGLIMWRKTSQNKTDIKPKELNWLWKGLLALIIGVLIVCFYFILKNKTVLKFWYGDKESSRKDMDFVLDAMVLAITICAMTLLTMRYSDQWYLWIICDLVLIIMYSTQRNYQFAITWSCGLVNACYGIYMWKFRIKKS